MIELYKLMPEVYLNASRDMQLLACLYEVVLNYIKTNADTIGPLPGNDADASVTACLARTLGFDSRRAYNDAQLRALVSIFPTILKNKGNFKAINLALGALASSENVRRKFKSELRYQKQYLATDYARESAYEIKNYELAAHIPNEVKDITLFLDTLPYIAPAGVPICIERAADET